MHKKKASYYICPDLKEKKEKMASPPSPQTDIYGCCVVPNYLCKKFLKKLGPAPSLQTDVYGRSAMPNYTLPFEMYVGQW